MPIFFPSEKSFSGLLRALYDIHKKESGSGLTDEDRLRLNRSLRFLLNADTKDDEQFSISGKPATVGCSEAVQHRFDLKKNVFGVSENHEVKSLLYLSKDGRTLYYFLMPGTTDLHLHVNDFAAPLSEDKMKEYGLIPYTVNPGTFLEGLKAKEGLEDMQVEIHIDHRLFDRELGFVTNNFGSRFVSCSMSVPRFEAAVQKELREVKEQFGERVHVLFHRDLSDFVYRSDSTTPSTSILTLEDAESHKQMLAGDHYSRPK
jgi:hypothetical protein